MKTGIKLFPVEFQYLFSVAVKDAVRSGNGINLIWGIIPDVACRDLRGTSVVMSDIWTET